MNINPNINLNDSFEKFKRGFLQARDEMNDTTLQTSQRLINAYTTLKCYSEMLLEEVEVKEETLNPVLARHESNPDDLPDGLFQQTIN